MILNPEKCHQLIINKSIANESIELGNKSLHAEAEQKLLGKIIDKDLKFQSRAKWIIKTVISKLSALIRVTWTMTEFNKKVIFNSLLKASSFIAPKSGCLALEL